MLTNEHDHCHCSWHFAGNCACRLLRQTSLQWSRLDWWLRHHTDNYGVGNIASQLGLRSGINQYVPRPMAQSYLICGTDYEFMKTRFEVVWILNRWIPSYGMSYVLFDIEQPKRFCFWFLLFISVICVRNNFKSGEWFDTEHESSMHVLWYYYIVSITMST